ncbi:MAG: radical SAM protein [Deltaproteobacteria bacterium]|nr:MAG: radical SAM protein [Deltaproteobacteria bacterium]
MTSPLHRLDDAQAAGMAVSLEMVRRAFSEGRVGAHPEDDTLIVALNYRCNSRCRFCIVAPEIDRGLDDANLTVFDAVYRANAAARREGRGFRRLTISGAESTLMPDLPALVARAVQAGGFDVVRLQTNARRLRDRGFAAALVDAGATEFFVSMHAPDRDLDAAITRSPRSFDEMRAGVANLHTLGARVLSNTVVCRANAHVLPAIADFLVAQRVQEAHWWSFLSIAGADQDDQLVDLPTALPGLLEALDLLDDAGIPAVVKWWPRCLLGRHGPKLDNHQPQMLIRDEFQVRLSHGFRFDCIHADRCRHFGVDCDGQHEAQARVFGDLADRLEPQP